MSRNLRRSRRAPKPKAGKSAFVVGDVVEIHRNGTNVKATLVQLLTEGSSANPRWLVNFTNPPHKEELYEHTFGAKFDAPPTSSEAGGADSGAKAGETASLTTIKRPLSQEKTGSSSSKSSSASNGQGESKKKPAPVAVAEPLALESEASKKKGVSFSDESSSNNSGKRSGRRSTNSNKNAGGRGSGSKDAKMSAREARSRRRQALMDEPSVSNSVPTVPVGGKRKVSGAAAMAAQNKRKRLEAAANNKSGESVQKIKFLTGTLYLYREGKRRRAEFVRRV